MVMVMVMVLAVRGTLAEAEAAGDEAGALEASYEKRQSAANYDEQFCAADVRAREKEWRRLRRNDFPEERRQAKADAEAAMKEYNGVPHDDKELKITIDASGGGDLRATNGGGGGASGGIFSEKEP